MAEEDIGNAVAILQDLSKFATLADRLQQGLLNFLFLGRLMKHPDGFASNDAFKIDGAPALNTSELYFDGNSQGAILGGSLCAVARDFRRCVLGEAGMNYSTLLNRSVDFDLYKLVLDGAYPDPFTQLLSLNIVQMLWDRGETNGYAQHLTRHAPPDVLVEALGLLPVRHGLPALAAGEHAPARRPRSARRHPADPGGPAAQVETAACLDVPEATVKTRLHRARALLRSQLDTALDVSADGVYAFGGQRCDRVVSTVMARIRAGEVPRTLDS